MKKQLLWCMAALSFSAASAQTYETRFARPLSDVLNDVAARFQVRLKYDVDTVGRVLPYADFRIRPYSLEETLTNVLSPFDYKFVKQSDKVYKLKPYEYARRTDADGEKMLAYLSGLYSDKSQWEQRREILRKEVRQRLGLDDMLGKTVKDAKPVLSKELCIGNLAGALCLRFSLCPPHQRQTCTDYLPQWSFWTGTLPQRPAAAHGDSGTYGGCLCGL